MKNYTVEQLLTLSKKIGVIHTIKEANNQFICLPSKPRKPSFPEDPGFANMYNYARDLEEYEKKLELYELKKTETFKFNSYIDKNLQDFIKIKSNLNLIPIKYQEKLYDYAYEQFRSEGYNSIYTGLCDLIEIFK